MKILWFAWKDHMHPNAGGAERVRLQIASRLIQDGHEVTFLVGGFKHALPEQIQDGIRFIRVGGTLSVYIKAYLYYKKHLSGKSDVVIDEINTIPFFCHFYVKEKSVLFIHQLAREVWFYQMIFPFSVLGYCLEFLFLFFLKNNQVITISKSTKNDLLKYGFHREKVHIITQGNEIEPLKNLEQIQKYNETTLLSVSTIRSMKRTLHILRAFEIIKKKIPAIRLFIVGSVQGRYGKKFLNFLQSSPYKDSILYFGRVSKEKKKELMQKSHIFLATSVREGWGLVITEANSQGTPAVVYDIPGFRDSVKDGQTGILCNENTPACLAQNVVELVSNNEKYQRLCVEANLWSQNFNFEKTYRDFLNILEKVRTS